MKKNLIIHSDNLQLLTQTSNIIKNNSRELYFEIVSYFTGHPAYQEINLNYLFNPNNPSCVLSQEIIRFSKENENKNDITIILDNPTEDDEKYYDVIVKLLKDSGYIKILHTDPEINLSADKNILDCFIFKPTPQTTKTPYHKL